VSGLLGGIALWRDWRNFVAKMPINIKETGFFARIKRNNPVFS
jgi:hypothetical protein